MKPLNGLSSRLGGRRTVLLLGGLYTGLGVLWPVVWVGSTLEVAEAVIIATLVGSAGLILLYGGHRLPRSDIHPTQYPVVATWCLRAIGVIGVVLLGITLTGQQTDPAHNFLILSALAAVAGFGAGSHDARAKTRAFVLEQRNMELEETQAKLEETVERLEASEQRYRTLAENFPNGTVALLDADLRYILVAGQGFDAVSYDADEIQGQSIEDAYPQAVVDDVEPHYRRTLAGEPTVFETTVEGHTFEVHLHPLTDDSGDVYAILAMSQDVTDRNARERELATRVDQQRLVADLGQLALETDDLDELMAEATQQVTDVLDIEYCKVLDLRQSEDELLLRQGVGWDAGLVGEATVSATEADSQAAYTLESKQPVVVADLETETRFGGPDLLRNHDVRSGISTSIGPADDP
ncbi:PAS domain-containing protein [Natrialbaceae archaeon A-CW3]